MFIITKLTPVYPHLIKIESNYFNLRHTFLSQMYLEDGV
jgi:hypothetical protein